MDRNTPPVPLRNVTLFAGLVRELLDRDPPDLPGLGVFYGPSGLGKTKASIWAANKYRAICVDVGPYITARGLMKKILLELGVANPRGSVDDMIAEAAALMAMDRTRPLLIDEAHWLADQKRFLHIIRELHDKSLGTIILIGEEALRAQIATFSRIDNCVLRAVEAVPCDLDDAHTLQKTICPGLGVAEELLRAILGDAKANTRRVVVHLAQVRQEALRRGIKAISLTEYPVEPQARRR